MSSLFAVLLLLAFIGLVLGLIKPRLVIYWGSREKKTRRKVLLYYGLAMVLFFIATGVTSPATTSEKTSASAQVKVSNESVQGQNHSKKGDEKPAQKPKTEKKTKAEPKQYKVGDWVTAGNLLFKVNGLRKAEEVGDEYVRQKANGVFLIIDMTVKNKDKEARTIDSSMFKLVSNGSTYDPSTDAEIYVNSNTDFFLQQLNPGLSITGKLVFDVPKDLKNVKLQVDSGVMFAGGEYQSIDLGF